MAISTYAELKTSVADFLNRDDLASVIPTFISLAEAQIQRDVRHYKMEARASGQVSGGDQYMQTPADWVESLRLQVASENTSVVDLVSMATISDKRAKANNLTGTPRFYAIVDGQFELFPTPSEDTDFELLYKQKIPALSDSVTSNWLLDTAPDVYLYGTLLHTAPYLQEDARVAVWAQLYSAAIQRLNQASDDAKFSGSGLTMKVRGLG